MHGIDEIMMRIVNDKQILITLMIGAREKQKDVEDDIEKVEEIV